MTVARVSLAVLAAAVVGGSATWLFVARANRPSMQPSTLPTPAAIGDRFEPPPPIAAAPLPARTAPDGDHDGLLLLPDGSRVPPLNGAVNPPRLTWNNPEWSPIVRTEHNGDLDWYVHADGSYSTTLMLWRSELGRTDAFSYALHPRDPVPTAPLTEEGKGQPDKR